MKTLVVYYSRTGNTKKIGKKIAKVLKADSDEIIDLKDRSRIITGWLISGRDAMLSNPADIKFKKDSSKYDLIIIGSPVWAWTVTPAIRAYLLKNKCKKVAFFCTDGGQLGKTFEEMAKLSKKPLATLEIKEQDIDSSDKKIKDFCRKLK